MFDYLNPEFLRSGQDLKNFARVKKKYLHGHNSASGQHESLGQDKVRFIKTDYGRSSQAISPEQQSAHRWDYCSGGDATTTASPIDQFIR